MKRILLIGEAMVELRTAGGIDLQYTCAVAGDVYNTAVYLKRLMGEAADVSFLTALGDDTLSPWMRDVIGDEGVSTEDLHIIAGATPGLYIIHTDEAGERSFTYWRSASAARSMLKAFTLETLTRRLASFELVYFSGITLAILPPRDALLLLLAAAQARATGTKIAFDPNYRPALWDRPGTARTLFDKAVASSDVVFPGMDDDHALYGSRGPADTVERLRRARPDHIVLKAGNHIQLLSDGLPPILIPVTQVAHPVDTTAAGDSFAAGFLSAWLDGLPPVDCVARAATVAAFIVTQPGAICPKASFDSFWAKARRRSRQ